MPRPQGKRTFTLSEKAQAVALLETEGQGCLAQTARMTGLSRATIREAAKDPAIVAAANVSKEELAVGFRNLTAKLLRHYDGMVGDADLSNKGTSLLGIVADKALLYANQPNQITANLDVNAYLQELVGKGFSEDDAKAIVEKAQARLSE